MNDYVGSYREINGAEADIEVSETTGGKGDL